MDGWTEVMIVDRRRDSLTRYLSFTPVVIITRVNDIYRGNLSTPLLNSARTQSITR